MVKNTKRKVPVLLVIIGITVAILAIGVAANALLKDKGTQTQPASEHDETNSDGHHSTSETESLGEEEDLTSQTEVSMNIEDFKYEKPNIKIKKGTTVTWTNKDVKEHNVMVEHANSDDAHDAPSADEVDPNSLGGPLLQRGESYKFTFNEVSDNPYHCSPHPYMKGRVTVVE